MIYLTSGDVAATVGSDKADAGVGSGLMLGPDGKTVGFDLFCEVKPNVWIPASQLPQGLLSEERRRGTLESGIFYAGKLVNRLNVHNIHDRLIAAKVGLELKADEYKGGSVAFKAEIGNPLEEIIKNIQGLIQQLEQLRSLDEEAKKAELEALTARVKRLKKKAVGLKEKEKTEQIKPEDVAPHPLDYLTDLKRTYTGKTLSTASLEMLCRAQRIADIASEGNDLILNPKKMAALRTLLLNPNMIRG